MISALPPWSNSDNKRQQLQQETTNPTTALEELRALAQRRGWLTVSAAAVTSGLLDRLGHAAAEHLNRAAEALDPDLRGDLTAAGIGIGTAYDPGADLARRLATVLSVLARHLDRQGAGMAVTVDELHAGQTDELRTLGIALQDVTRLARLTPFEDDDPPCSPTPATPKFLTGWFTS